MREKVRNVRKFELLIFLFLQNYLLLHVWLGLEKVKFQAHTQNSNSKINTIAYDLNKYTHIAEKY